MPRTPVPEAALVQTEAGLRPAGDGWFVVNLADAAAVAGEGAGHAWTFEGDVPFPHFGLNIHVLQPGEPASLYHGEEGQEAFLVLQGECALVVEEQERRLRQWDFFHAPPWTRHVLVGAGSGSCAILMVGARNAGEGVVYPASDAARRHGASAARDTTSQQEAYAGWAQIQPARRPWPPA